MFIFVRVLIRLDLLVFFNRLEILLICHMGACGSAVGSGTALQVDRSRVQLEFFIDITLPAAWWPWGRLSL
jgi:hypothetical protein